ncbi:hypothetical protein GCM10029964_075690 [Kibdelosporangium lantanae]
MSANGRYFATPDGIPVLLTGAHTWQNLQDTGFTDPPPRFDYQAYLDRVTANGQNFFRLWTWEQARYSVEIANDSYFTAPSPYARTGPGLAIDGKPRFDLASFDPGYFSRLRTRVQQAGARGVYVSVMLFNGWSLQARKGDEAKNNPWKGHPYNAANNVNGVDGDVDGNGSGDEVHTLASPRVTELQERYVRKVIDTVGDLGNVLYEIANEGPEDSGPWQYQMINYVKAHDNHPVGMTAIYPDGDNRTLWDSPPTGSPPTATSTTHHHVPVPRWCWRTPTTCVDCAGTANGPGSPSPVGKTRSTWMPTTEPTESAATSTTATPSRSGPTSGTSGGSPTGWTCSRPCPGRTCVRPRTASRGPRSTWCSAKAAGSRSKWTPTG